MRVYIGVKSHIGDMRFGPGCQGHFSGYAVPVGLGVLGYAVGPLIHRVGGAVVDAHRDYVDTRSEFFCEVPAVGSAQAFIGAGFLSVDVEGGDPVATLKVEGYVAVFPLVGDGDFALIPCLTEVLIFAAETVDIGSSVFDTFSSGIGGAREHDGF